MSTLLSRFQSDMERVRKEMIAENNYRLYKEQSHSRLLRWMGVDLAKEETKMQKEYEYKANGVTNIMPGGIAGYNPSDTEFGKFIKWIYSSGMNVKPDRLVVEKLVEEKRFGWLDWLSEHTPFVTRTEKKAAYKFTPENLKLEFREDGSGHLKMYGIDGNWWHVLRFDAGKAIAVNCCVSHLPIMMDGSKAAITSLD